MFDSPNMGSLMTPVPVGGLVLTHLKNKRKSNWSISRQIRVNMKNNETTTT